jgi:DNA invertase Pin-like site-specific DNA recombinase
MVVHCYSRISTDLNLQEHSLETQKTRIDEYCNFAHKDEPRVYYQDMASGKNTQRPEFQRMMTSLKKGDTICIYSLSRLSRSVKDSSIIFDELENLGVGLYSIEDRFDSTTPAGRLQRNMMISMNQFERENTIQRIKDSIKRLKEDNLLRGKPPYGYSFAGKKKPFVVNEEEMKIIQRIIEIAKTYKCPNLVEIAEKVNREGLKLRKAKKIYPGVVKKILLENGWK